MLSKAPSRSIVFSIKTLSGMEIFLHFLSNIPAILYFPVKRSLKHRAGE
jgi:hypothetical protein